MNAGRELDALVAEKVMNWNKGVRSLISDFPHYSTDIAAAWQVVEKLCPKEDEFRLTRYCCDEWECNFAFFIGKSVFAETAPHAICLAGLKAMGIETEL